MGGLFQNCGGNMFVCLSCVCWKCENCCWAPGFDLSNSIYTLLDIFKKIYLDPEDERYLPTF